jgi:hypothetical protein
VPYFKCTACRIRLSRADADTELVDAGCPECGQPWEPAAQLGDLIGYRLAPAGPTPPAASGQGLWRLAARVAEVRGDETR